MAGSIVGADGNNAPATIEGIPARLYYGILGRSYTYVGREPFNPDFGLGLVDGISNPSLPRAVWVSRVRRSFRGLEGAELDSFQIRAIGNVVHIDLEILTEAIG